MLLGILSPWTRSRFEGIRIGHGRVGWRCVASEDAWDMGQRNGNSFYLAGSSQMAEFKEYLSIYLSLQRDFYPNKGHADASCHIMMYHCLRRSKVPFKKLSSIFLSPKNLLLELHRDGWMRMHIVVYLMPSTFPRIGMILDEFRFAASGVSWKMGPIYKYIYIYCKDL